MSKSASYAGFALLVACMLVLAGCNNDDKGQSAQAQVQQAKQELAQAKANLAEAKAQAEADEADADQADGGDAAAAAQEPADTHQSNTGPESGQGDASASTQAQICADCGTIRAIQPVMRQTRQVPEAVGTILGGAAGAALGHQIGGGSGKTIATIVGAIGGAFAGHEAQQRLTTDRVFRVTVRMDAGGTRTITVPSAKRIAEGMRVRVRGGNIVLM